MRNAPDPRALADKARRSRRPAAGTQCVKKRAKRLRPDEVQELIAHYRENGSVTAAAKALSITRQTAGAYLSEAGIATVHRMSDADVTEAVSAYEEGQSAARIGRRLGFDPQTVLTALRRASVAIRPSSVSRARGEQDTRTTT
ncbi:DNA-directed RNA polymerase specialized sigma24 family protein [Microbacterium ginsengiterrae]|uniref:DNA-directed RNA polymerase specialized sigma24 family protein n=1 Tax=Microbacterium ginsengiterrae TaxID=546115 RepID=A0A7W9CAA7_9MICO|nr:DNA-directed RNA polymerase specialized sigma24 family protein [Microbacterium ginsengiterrae]